MLLSLCLAVFSFFLSVYMFAPFFALYVKSLGGSYAEFAAILSLMGFVVSAIQSYIGYLSDKMGPKLLVFAGGILSTFGYLFIGITYNKFFIIPLYLFMNIGMGILLPSLFTLISYQKTAKDNSFIPVYRSIQSIGVVIGPVVGGWLMRKSYRVNVILGGIIMLISLGLFSIYFLNHNNNSIAQNSKQRQMIHFKETLIDIFQNRSFVITMILFALIELSYDLINISLPIVGEELDFSTNITGIALSAYFLTYSLFQIQVNHALKRIKKRTALMLMGGLSLIPCGLLLLDLPACFTILSMGGIGLTIGSLFTFCTLLASEQSPENKKGAYLGIFNTIMPLTDVISPVIVVFFISISVKLSYAAAAVLILLFVILSGFLYTDK